MSFQSSVQQAKGLSQASLAYLGRANAIKPVENLANVVDIPFGEPIAKRRCRVCDSVINPDNKVLMISRCCSTECEDRVNEMNQARDFWPDEEVEEVDHD